MYLHTAGTFCKILRYDNNVGAKTLITVEEFGKMHFSDTEDYELVVGELIPLSGGTPRHAKIRGRLERLLGHYFDQLPVGEVFAELDCRVIENRVRRPDLSIFLEERLSQIDLDKIPRPSHRT